MAKIVRIKWRDEESCSICKKNEASLTVQDRRDPGCVMKICNKCCNENLIIIEVGSEEVAV